MEEATSWKGHTFTLFVFAGIVVLCSIFFVLGMLVARAQAQKLAPADANASILKGEAKRGVPEDKSEFTFYDAVKKEAPAEFDRAPAKLETPPAPTAPADPLPAPAAASPVLSNTVNYQVGAVRKRADAEKVIDELKAKGFRGFIVDPAADDPNPFFRVQVGPFADSAEAQTMKKDLEAAGYRPILKK